MIASLNAGVFAPKALSARAVAPAGLRMPAAMPGSSSSRGVLQVVAASKKKDVRLTITLECTEQKESGVPGMSRYMTQKVGVPSDPLDARARPQIADKRTRGFPRLFFPFRSQPKPQTLSGLFRSGCLSGEISPSSLALSSFPSRRARRSPRSPRVARSSACTRALVATAAGVLLETSPPFALADLLFIRVPAILPTCLST